MSAREVLGAREENRILKAAFGNLHDAALAGLAGATPEQIERIEEAILSEIYAYHTRRFVIVAVGEPA